MLPAQRYVGQRSQILRAARNIISFEQRITLALYLGSLGEGVTVELFLAQGDRAISAPGWRMNAWAWSDGIQTEAKPGTGN